MEPQKKERRGAPPGHHGNPPFVPTDQQRADVRSWVKVMGADAIADYMGIHRSTLDKHFKKELANGRFELGTVLGTKAITLAMANDRTMLKFVLTHICKWTPRIEIVGAGGGPIRFLDIGKAIENYSEEQLALIEPLLEQLIAAGSADFDFRDQLGAPADQDPQG